MTTGNWGTLPTVTVYANPPLELNPYWGTGPATDFPVGMPPQYDPVGMGIGALANGAAVFNASFGADSKASLRCLEEFCKGISGRPAAYALSQLSLVKQFHSYMAWYAQYAGVSEAGFTLQDTQVENGAKIAGLFGDYFYRKNTGWTFDSGKFDWHVGPLMPIAALAHWVDGNGQNVKISLNALGLTLQPSQIKGGFYEEIRKYRPAGSFPINMRFSYNTFNQGQYIGGTIGRVQGEITGTLTVKADGTFTFDGSYTLLPDYYNADAGDRTWYQESLTTFLNWIGETFGQTDYWIEFDGSVPFIDSGTVTPMAKPDYPPIDASTFPIAAVFPNPASGDPYWGYGADPTIRMPDPIFPPADNVVAAYEASVNGQAFFTKIEQADPIGVLDEFSKQISGRPASVALAQLRTWGQMSDYMSANWTTFGYPAAERGISLAKAAQPGHIANIAGEYLWGVSAGYWNPNKIEREWAATPLLPIKAMWHWVNGRGMPVSIPTNALGLTLPPSELQGEMQNFLKQQMQQRANRFLRKFSYDASRTFIKDMWAAGTVGRFSGQVIGIVWVNTDGSYIFDGDVHLDPVTYNGGRTHSAWPTQAQTDFVQGIGQAWGHTDYQISFTGTQRLLFTGVLDVSGVPVLPA